jgi:hypothetical protein
MRENPAFFHFYTFKITSDIYFSQLFIMKMNNINSVKTIAE